MSETTVRPQPAIHARAQFKQMLEWMGRGWFKLPSGYVCMSCGGALWGKEELNGRYERHTCSGCGWTHSYAVK